MTNNSLLFSQEELLLSYQNQIRENVSKIVIDGILNYGNLLNRLDTPRRGWLISGIHPDIAESSKEDSTQLVESATSYCCNPTSEI